MYESSYRETAAIPNKIIMWPQPAVLNN